MKTIRKIAEFLGLEVAVLKFSSHGHTSKGYSLYSRDWGLLTGYSIQIGTDSFPEVMVFEPKENGVWMVKDNRPEGRLRYLKPNEFRTLINVPFYNRFYITSHWSQSSFYKGSEVFSSLALQSFLNISTIDGKYYIGKNYYYTTVRYGGDTTELRFWWKTKRVSYSSKLTH